MLLYGIYDQEYCEMQVFTTEKQALHKFKEICKNRGYSKEFRKDLINRYNDRDGYVNYDDDYCGLLILQEMKIEK